MKISDIVQDSTVDGPGLRTVVFVQGCPHDCQGCHNKETHDFAGGTEMSVAQVMEIIASNPLIKGVTLSGGEPFCQAEELDLLVREIEKHDLGVWCYTGFTYEHLVEVAKFNRHVRNLLQGIDVLVDGRFEIDKKDERLLYCGSSNQRLLKLRYGKVKGEWSPKTKRKHKLANRHVEQLEES